MASLKDSLKAAGAVAVLAAGVAVSALPRGVQICSQGPNKNECVFYSADDFTARKRVLADKIEKNNKDNPLTNEEYNEVISILDYTVRQKGGITFSNVSSTTDLRSLVIEQLK